MHRVCRSSTFAPCGCAFVFDFHVKIDLVLSRQHKPTSVYGSVINCVTVQTLDLLSGPGSNNVTWTATIIATRTIAKSKAPRMFSTRQTSCENSANQLHRNDEALISAPEVGTTSSGLKTGACDRCRGQKLRCMWDTGMQRCRRCDKANSICAILPPRHMGRPFKQQLKHAQSHRQQKNPRTARYQQVPAPEETQPHVQQYHQYQHSRRQSATDSTGSLFQLPSAYSTNVTANMEDSGREIDI